MSDVWETPEDQSTTDAFAGDCYAIAIDIVGPIERTQRKNQYILTFMDYATKYPAAVPLKNSTRKAVADALFSTFADLGRVVVGQWQQLDWCPGDWSIGVITCQENPDIALPSQNEWDA